MSETLKIVAKYNEDQLPDLLRLYYNRLFPYTSFYKWLSYGLKSTFANREISFTLLGDIYIRYQSFDTETDFSTALQKRCPIKIDIGAVYAEKPKARTLSAAIRAMQKEIVFDIDMTDYDEVRTCCKGVEICNKCWKFMIIACKILDAAMREDFGYKHLLWVFSGRRGIHCWVCDEAARKCNDTERAAIGEYLQIISSKKISFPWDKMHTSIKRALEIIEPYFEEMIIIDQNALGTKEGISQFLSLVDHSAFSKELEEAFTKVVTSEERWSIFLQKHQSQAHNVRSLKFLRESIMIYYTYPRIDINVSKTMNHLLKSPFSVHPKTGKVSIPFNPKLVDKFDPFIVPNIRILAEEINAFDEITKQQDENIAIENENHDPANVTISIKKKIKEYRKTSLLKPINYFDEFIRTLERDSNLSKQDNLSY